MTKIKTRKLKYSIFFSIFFSILTTFGACLDSYSTIFVNFFWLFVIVFILSFGFVYGFFALLPKIKKINQIKISKKIDGIFFSGNKKSFWMCFGFMWLCYLPVLFAYFPGLFTYDVFYQIQSIVQLDPIEIHPIVHTILIYLTFLLAKFSNNSTLAILLYTVLQMSVMIAIFSYFVQFLSKYKLAPVFKIFALLFFALYPINQIFSLIATKDVLFSGFVLLGLTLLYELIAKKEEFINITKNKLLYILSFLFIFLFRHNGVYAYILLSFFLFYYFKKDIKKVVLLILMPLLLYFSFCSIKTFVGIKKPPIASFIGIPLQQMARVRFIYKDNLSKDEILKYRKIVPKRNEFSYHPYCADFIKLDMDKNDLHSDVIERNFKNNKEIFVNLYLSWAKKYPKEYIDAFLEQNNIYWYVFKRYPNLGAHYFIYTGNAWSEIYGVKIPLYSAIPFLTDLYNSWFMGNKFEKNIITYIAFSMGINFWVLAMGFTLLLYQKKYKPIITLLFIPFLFLTVLFGPVALLRYIYQNYIIIPFLFAFCFGNFKKR